MNGPVKVAVCGALGRMGQKVIQAVSNRQAMLLAGAAERPDHPLTGQNISYLPGLTGLDIRLAASLSDAANGAAVYIDFTSIESSLAYLREAVDLKIGAVIGTTGFSVEQQKELAKAAERIPVLWAPNMSTGVNVMYKIAAAMTKMLGRDFDIEIIEAHHRLKKDAPSGTAVKLHDTVAKARGLAPEASLITGRNGLVGERTAEEIGVLAVRGGDIVGDHTVIFAGPGERLELVHRAHTRDTFAEGAVRVAAWLAGRGPGLYSIDDTLAVEDL